MIIIQNHLLCSWEQGGEITAWLVGWKQTLKRVTAIFNVCFMLSVSFIAIAQHVNSRQFWVLNVFLTEHISQNFTGGGPVWLSHGH